MAHLGFGWVALGARSWKAAQMPRTEPSLFTIWVAVKSMVPFFGTLEN